jgi:hypothetical protein
MTKDELIKETIKIFRSRKSFVFPDLIMHDDMDDYTFLHNMRAIINTATMYKEMSLSSHADSKEIFEGLMLKERGKE